jgi:hypothetical protein
MRKIKQLLVMATVAAGATLLIPGTSNAQVIGNTTINPYTGQVYRYSAGYNPLTNQYGSSRVVINPYTGFQTGVGIGQNPYTGTIYRTEVIRDPWTGGVFTSRQRYNPLINQYRWRANYRGW